MIGPLSLHLFIPAMSAVKEGFGVSTGIAQLTMSLAMLSMAFPVTPGFIESPMTDALTEQQKTQILTTIPSGKLGQGEDVAAACVYLASAEAGYVTGQTLHVNGGMAMI